MTSPPKTRRHCRKCGAETEHTSSGLFRVNANRKQLDVWLVYRCNTCKTSWNSTILSRVHPKKIGEGLLQQFHNNDPALALHYAMDAGLLKRNGAEAESPDIQIIGEEVALTHNAAIEIYCRYPAQIKLSRVLREKLALSGKAFAAMAASGAIRLEDGADVRKAKLRQRCVVLLCVEES